MNANRTNLAVVVVNVIVVLAVIVGLTSVKGRRSGWGEQAYANVSVSSEQVWQGTPK